MSPPPGLSHLLLVGVVIGASAAPSRAAARQASSDERVEAERESDELWAQGRRSVGLERLLAALALAPSDRALRLKLVRRELEVHRYTRALEHLAPLEQVAGSAADVRPLRARAHYMLGHYEAAGQLLSAEDPVERLLLVRCLQRLGRHAEADPLLDLALTDPAAAVLLGQRHARAGDFAAAAREFRRALARDALDAEALFGLGQALLRSGSKAEGLALLERHRELVPLLDELDFARRSIDLDPSHAPGYAQLGDVERKLGRHDRALANYERAERLATDDEIVPIALRLARHLEMDRGDSEGALATLARATERKADVRLLVRRGDVLARTDRHALAVRAYEAALELRPGDRAISERRDAAQRRTDARRAGDAQDADDQDER